MVERTDQGGFHSYVTDFGLARETAGTEQSRTGLIEGTPRYMAPEQARGDIRHLDRRTDVYALGVTLYELLTGQTPHRGDSELDILLSVLTEEPPPLRALEPSVPADLEAVTLKCLEKEPTARYDSARALAEELGRYLDGVPVLARPIGRARRLYRGARKHKPLVALGAALLLLVLGFATYGARQELAAREREQRARRQAELAERLGQEIKDMEWTLRSSRQLPLHDLGHEKALVRTRMQQLKQELEGYGALGRGLVHYALGRGHLALHEYPQALAQLQQALQAGQKSAEVHYALGLALGKHYEQAMYQARLSGGGQWAKKQLQRIEPQYLQPAIAALQRSQALQRESSGYLEALLSYYQRDYEAALRQARATQQAAPWLYESTKLAGDIYLERALQARDHGRYEEATREFADAVRSYQAAASIGQSDAQIYEGLAEAWIRQIEMAGSLGRPTDEAYEAAIAASDKIDRAEPGSTAGLLKKAYASSVRIGILRVGHTSATLAQRCLSAAEEVLQRDANNPYASDLAANCYVNLAEAAQAQGQDSEQLRRRGIEILERTMHQYPNFLWGASDLAISYTVLASEQAVRGDERLRATLEKSLSWLRVATSLDDTFINPSMNALVNLSILIQTVSDEREVADIVARADDLFAQCTHINVNNQECYGNYFLVFIGAAQRLFVAGKEPGPLLARGFANYEITRKTGGPLLDAEQSAALGRYIEAAQSVRQRRDPGQALAELQAALGRCFTIAATDATCRTLAAQAEWVAADWLALQHLQFTQVLRRALAKATLATQSPELYPGKWQVLAQTHLRLARAALPAARAEQVHAGLAAVARSFAVNPNHALSLATKGELLLLRAQSLTAPAPRRATAQEAADQLAQALRRDPLLSHDYAATWAQAKALAAAP